MLETRLASLVADIYEAVLDEASLAKVAGGLAGLVDGCSAVISIDGAAILGFNGLEADAVRAYVDGFVGQDPWLELGHRMPPECLINTEALLPVGKIETTAFYNEFIRPVVKTDIVRLAGGPLMRLDEGTVFLGVMRERRQPRFDGRDLAALRATLPHLQRLMAIRRRMSEATQGALHADATLDALGTPIIRADRDGRVVYANPEAEHLLAEGGGLVRARGRQLAAAVAEETVRLIAAICQACDGQGASLALSRPSARRPIAVIAIPAPPRLAGRRGEALLFLSDPHRLAPALTQRLRNLFGLTLAEAEVAVAVGRGEDLAEISLERGVKVSTLREQISSIFAKTGAERQAELAALVARLAALG